MKHLFIAFKLTPDDNTINVYNSLRKALKYNNIRWVEPDKFHLTLTYIGSTPEDKISSVVNIIQETCKSRRVINFSLNRIGIFGSRYSPRVIWFGVTSNNKIENIATEIINRLDKAGFNKDRQNFIPHITIARITKIVDKQLFNKEMEDVNSIYLQKSVFDKVILFESVLSNNKTTHNEIFSFSFSK